MSFIHFQRPHVGSWILSGLALLLAWDVGTATAKPPHSKQPAAAAKIRLPESIRQPRRVEMDVAPVIESRRAAVSRLAARLDLLVEQKLRAQEIPANPRAEDEAFLRRVYLDVAGRIPTLAEAQSFLASTESDRRERLIDELLGSPDYVSNFYNFWADVLRLVERPQPNIIAEPYLAYVKDSIRTNTPYDQWVYEMLTANGKSWENPAVGYQLRDEGMPLAYVDNTLRIFLGTQIGCAQCHDHPFENWTQLEFYQLAAWTAGTRTRIRKGDPGFEKTNPANALISEARKQYDKGRVPGQFQRIARANTYVVSEVKSSLRLPHDYAYQDAKPKQLVEPAVLWGDVPTSAKTGTKRERFAAWLTSAENPQFSRTLVNRIWKRLLGVALVEPVDDFSGDNPCANEPLLAFLSEELVRDNFNVKELLRLILYSDTYQREASDYDPSSGELYYFPGPVVRRMTAEQVWDSILTLAVHNPWPFQRPSAKELADVVDLDFATADFAHVKQLSERFGETYFLPRYKRRLNVHAYQGNVLCRASELPSPVPANHFLRQFGQGDRETINSAQQDPTVPQILAMFNGPITHVMLEAGSAIVDNVLAIEQTRERVDVIFLSVLGRHPNSSDRRVAAGELAREPHDAIAYGNIIWGLLNTREFLFVQ